MKKYFPILFLVIVGVVLFVSFNETVLRRPGPLAEIRKQIDVGVGVVYRTGSRGKVTFVSETDGILVMSPPYADMSQLGKDAFSQELRQKMQSFVDRQETGHLFYIAQGNLTDHRLLSGLGEPILGMGTGKEVVFEINRTPTSGRPVRIEIVKE